MSPVAIDLIGKRFTRLVAKKLTTLNGRRAYVCICDCGVKKVVEAGALRDGGTKSCGCYNVEQVKRKDNKHRTHGMRYTPTYRVWVSMKQRCSPKASKSKNYKEYYLKGVRVCERWRESFENFLADMGERPSMAYTIDRIDNSKGYEPGNCRWATLLEQNQNRSTCLWLEYKGLRLNAAEWSRRTGLCVATIHSRIKRGWSIEDTLEKPLQVHTK
jgi:hypothetical protein